MYAACATYVVLPSFPWRASTSVHDGRPPVFSRVHVHPVHGPCKGPSTRRVPRTWFCPVFHGPRQLPSTTAVGHFFPVSTFSPFTSPCKGPRTCVCLVCGFAQFSMARVHSRQRQASARFFTCTRSRVRVRVRVCVCVFVPSMWFSPVFQGAGPFPSTTGIGQFFHVYPFSPFTGQCKGLYKGLCA